MKIHDGSTGICAIIRDSKLLVANVGDCRALVISNRKAIQMSIDQKPTNPDEQKRIAALGGTVVYCMGVARVNRVLAVSRAFGNRTLRTVIRPDAEMMQRDLTKDDDYLVMASDGLWDVLKNKDVTEICYLNSLQGNTQLIADELAHTALNRGSMDNVTCLVIRISEFLENEDNYNTINRRVDSPSMRGRKNYASDTDGTYRSSDVSGIDSLSNSSFKLLGHMGVNRADSVVLSSNLEETENSMQPTRNSGGARIPFIKIPSNQTMQGSFDSPSGRLAKSNSTSILPHHLDNPGSSVASPMTKKLESIRLNEDLTQSTIDESEGESGKSLGIRHKTGNGVHTPTSANVAGPRRPSSLNDASLRAALTSGMPHILSMFGGSSKEEIGNGNGKKTAIVGWSETGNQ